MKNFNLENERKKLYGKIDKIKKVAIATGMSGRLGIDLNHLTVKQFDELLDSLDKVKKYGNYIAITDKLDLILTC